MTPREIASWGRGRSSSSSTSIIARVIIGTDGEVLRVGGGRVERVQAGGHLRDWTAHALATRVRVA